MIRAIAAQQILALRRQGFVMALLLTLLAMTAVAGLLGWSSHHTITGVYDQAVKLLASRGQSAPLDPFQLKPHLSLLSNTVIYVSLIGALLAVLIGHLSVADDQSGGVGRLVFTRPMPRSSYVGGKVLGAGVVLAAALAVSLIIGVVELFIVNRTMPTGVEVERLVLFYSLSWLYLMGFVLIGMIAVLMTRSRSLSLLSAMGAWLVVTFVAPQLTSGLRPTASLNPIADPVGTSQSFFKVTTLLRPLSVAEQYKSASGAILQTGLEESIALTTARAIPIAGLLAVLALAAVLLVQHHDFSRGSAGA